MEPSIYTRIINGELPSYKVYEDEKVIVILDIEPLVEGHCLVIPKQQVDHLWDIEDELYQHLFKIAKQTANRQRQVLQPQRVGMALEGFGVPHAHIHVFPLNEGLEKAIADKIATPQPKELEAMAKRLAF